MYTNLVAWLLVNKYCTCQIMHGKQKTHTYLTQQTSVDNGGHTVNQPLLIIQQKLMEQTTLSNHAIKEM